MKKLLSVFFVVLMVISMAGCGSNNASTKAKNSADNKQAAKPEKIVLDYAYYSPASLVVKEFGWADQEFKKDGIKVEYVLSQGSNKALEFLNSNSVDFGSTAGGAALIAKAKGAPIKSVYISSRPEWTALLSNKGSGITSVKDLKGKKVAATVGTDPYIFLLRALNKAGLSANDIQLVNLQHPDGAAALQTHQVDAWAGLDPHMAKAELQSNAKIFYRNKDFNTYCSLNVRTDFAKKYPEYVKRVIKVNEKARKWIIANPDKAAQLLAKSAQISKDVAKKELERNDFSAPIPGQAQEKSWNEAGIVLQNAGIIQKDVNVKNNVSNLIDPTFVKEVIKN